MNIYIYILLFLISIIIIIIIIIMIIIIIFLWLFIISYYHYYYYIFHYILLLLLWLYIIIIITIIIYIYIHVRMDQHLLYDISGDVHSFTTSSDLKNHGWTNARVHWTWRKKPGKWWRLRCEAGGCQTLSGCWTQTLTSLELKSNIDPRFQKNNR